MKFILLLPFILSFFVAFFMLPHWIRRTQTLKLVGKDINKIEGGEVSESGGVCVVSGFVLGVLVYIAIITFYFGSKDNVANILAVISTVTIISFIGLLDDLFGWKIGLSKLTRLFWILMAAVPLIVINVGSSFLLGINIGLLYPLFIIPLAIVGVSTTFNFLAGYNGLEAGMGVLILGAFSIVSALTGNSWLSIIGLCMIYSLIAFLIFNKYPAKVLPGNITTYSVGALIAAMAIIGSFEKFALFIFIPYFIEIVLKVRGKLKKESFAKPNKDGSIDLLYDKFYGLEHVMLWAIKKIKPNHKVYEYELVFGIWIVQLIFIILGLVIFRTSIFGA